MSALRTEQAGFVHDLQFTRLVQGQFSLENLDLHISAGALRSRRGS